MKPLLHFIKSKILTDRKYLLLIVVALVLIPLISDAVLGTGLFDLFSAIHHGIAEKTHPIFAFLITLFIFLFLSLSALNLSTWLFDYVSDPGLLTISNNDMVQVGWQFTSSIANTLIVIALVFIGIATIMGLDKYEYKKTLPRLIIVALLINFSLVFVGAFVDISNFVINTFYEAGLLDRVMGAVLEAGNDYLVAFAGFIVVTIAALAIPVSSPFYTIALAISVVGVLAGEATGLFSVINMILQIVASFLAALVILYLAVLFIARIFVIQILAIFSPLAFVAWVIPATQSWAKRWLSMLLNWSFMAIPILFLLLLSTVAVEPLRVQTDTDIPLGASHLYIYYFMLIIYLVITAIVAQNISKKFAGGVLQQVDKYGGSALKKGTNYGMSQYNRLERSIKSLGSEDRIKEAEKKMKGEGSFLQRNLAKAENQAGKWVRRQQIRTGREVGDEVYKEDKKKEKEKDIKRVKHLTAEEREGIKDKSLFTVAMEEAIKKEDYSIVGQNQEETDRNIRQIKAMDWKKADKEIKKKLKKLNAGLYAEKEWSAKSEKERERDGIKTLTDAIEKISRELNVDQWASQEIIRKEMVPVMAKLNESRLKKIGEKIDLRKQSDFLKVVNEAREDESINLNRNEERKIIKSFSGDISPQEDTTQTRRNIRPTREEIEVSKRKVKNFESQISDLRRQAEGERDPQRRRMIAEQIRDLRRARREHQRIIEEGEN